MKQLLTALLILICFSCGDEHDKNYPRNDTTQKEREHDEVLDAVSDWTYSKCNEYFDKSIFLSNASGNRDSIDKYNYLGRAMREVFMKVISLKYRNKKKPLPPKPSPLPDTTKPLIDSTGIVLAKALEFPKYEGQRLLLFDRKGNAHTYYDSAGWIVIDWFRGDDLVYKSDLPDRFSPKTIDSIVKYSQSPWQEKTTTKPLNIKMQPRWRDSIRIDVGSLTDDTISVITHFDPINDSVYSGWLTKGAYDSFLNKVDTSYYQQSDTTKCLLLVSDTSSQNGFRSQRCFWMYGYQVSKMSYGELTSMYCTDKEGNVIKCPDSAFYEYLNENKRSLPKNIVVWMSKEIK